MIVVAGIAANRHPDPRTEFPHQFRQEFGIAGAKALAIGVIGNWSALSPVGNQWVFPADSAVPRGGIVRLILNITPPSNIVPLRSTLWSPS